MTRLIYLDGLRGIAALMVVLSHFVVGFLPMLYFQGAFNSYGYASFVEYITKSPIIILFSGNLAVCIFFVLSGFVLSVGLIENKRQVNFLSLLIKRYVRLVIPIIASVLFACFLLKNGLFFNQEVGLLTQSTNWLVKFYLMEPSWLYALKSGILVTFDPAQTMYNEVLWTMPYEFLGSCIIFLILVIKSIFSNGKSNTSLFVGMYVLLTLKQMTLGTRFNN